jgi:transcription elongation factor Elf1
MSPLVLVLIGFGVGFVLGAILVRDVKKSSQRKDLIEGDTPPMDPVLYKKWLDMRMQPRKDLITEGPVCKGGLNDPPTTPPPGPPSGTIPRDKRESGIRDQNPTRSRHTLDDQPQGPLNIMGLRSNDFFEDKYPVLMHCNRCHQPYFGNRDRDLCRWCQNEWVESGKINKLDDESFFDVNLYCPFCGHIQKNVKSGHIIPVIAICSKCQRIFDVRPLTEEEKNPKQTPKELYDAAIKALHELAEVHFTDNIKLGQCFVRCLKCMYTWETDNPAWTHAMCPRCHHQFENNSSTSIVPKPPPLRHIRESDDKPLPEKVSQYVDCPTCSHHFLVEYIYDKRPESVKCPKCSITFESQMFHPTKPMPPENVVLREDQDYSDIKPGSPEWDKQHKGGTT